ncbi:ABC transporter ATP-binding protein [Micromonospora chalcea]|uniref:ATP-binding cassette domain-containing protein n=2 Tax=Micromonospora chalcea TaxID=1874 RepID=UPI00340EB6C6
MAAHIYAASPTGPRGTGGLSAAERSEPENGIWCCATHGKSIDSDAGRIFSAVQLKAWKRLHEARKAAEINGGALSHVGLVESISVNSSPVTSLEGRKFELGMRNIFTGQNGSGKSVLTRLIASVAYPDHVAELSRDREVDMGVRWFDPMTHDVATKGRSGVVTHVLDGEPVPYVARPYKTILLQPAQRGEIENLNALAQMFDLSTSAMRSTLGLLPADSDLVKEVQCLNGKVHWTLDVNGRTERFTGRGGLSLGSEPLILLELAGLHARHHARVEPTFLLLDEFFGFHDIHTQIAALERLELAAEHAQVAVVSHSPQIVQRVSADWSTTVLEHRPRNRWDTPLDFEVETKSAASD